MNPGRPPYDEQAVSLVVEIDDHIAGLGPPTDQRIRRARMIRAAIEGQVEYVVPPPHLDVLELLGQAILRDLGTLDAADTDWVGAQLNLLKIHVQGRSHPT